MLKEDKVYLDISGIQHFVYCKRQWALIHLEQQWVENELTAHGRVVHNRVHDSSVRDANREKKTIRGLRVSSREYCIAGVCDAVEFHSSADGVKIFGFNGTWEVHPVEYKRGHSKSNDCDRMQVMAQALCLEEMLCCDIPFGFLYYAESRRREKVIFDDLLRTQTINIIDNMMQIYLRGISPKPKFSKGCRACSLHDICMPELEKKSVMQYIKKYLDEDEK